MGTASGRRPAGEPTRSWIEGQLAKLFADQGVSAEQLSAKAPELVGEICPRESYLGDSNRKLAARLNGIINEELHSVAAKMARGWGAADEKRMLDGLLILAGQAPGFRHKSKAYRYYEASLVWKVKPETIQQRHRARIIKMLAERLHKRRPRDLGPSLQ